MENKKRSFLLEIANLSSALSNKAFTLYGENLNNNKSINCINKLRERSIRKRLKGLMKDLKKYGVNK